MKKFKFLLLTLSSSTFLFANCTYDLNINFDFSNKLIDVETHIKDTQKSLQLDLTSFNIENKKNLIEKLKNGANNVSFSYKKNIENLNENYIYLLNNWYPTLNTMCNYNLRTNLPSNYKTVYENTNKEIDNFNFIASKEFIIRIKKHNDITIKTYFLKNNESLVKKYFDKTIEYIKLYEKTIGKYPYNEFKIVENIYQTGYSMPTYTLIGSRLLDKDYILNQSLGHEILHQYFGNSVFNDFSKGNWVEGLTTYLADDYYKKLNKKDVENRKIVLNQYETFVNTNNEFSIDKFTHKYNKISSMIGYSKLSYVFHMLEKKIGEKKFNDLIKMFYKKYKFKEANLNDLALFFNNNTNIELKGFFEQWLYKKGQIDFELENIKNSYDKDGFWLTFDIVQKKENFFSFELPIEINTYDKTIQKTIKVDNYKQSVKLNFESEILNFTADKNYDLFRKLSKKESFKAISSFLTNEKIVGIINTKDLKKYSFLKRTFKNIDFISTNEVKFKDIKENNTIFFDTSNELLKQFFPKDTVYTKNSFIKVKPHIYNDKKAMAIVNVGDYKKRYLSMLKHFSQYSEVILSKNDTKKLSLDTKNGIYVELAKLATFSKVQDKNSIDKISEEIKNKKIIYVGESHTNFEHHLNQLRVIKSLHQKGKDIAIGMEMFQAPFQKHLDKYIEGKTSLNKFLKDSQYFKRWVYDYNLYKPIIDYAKKNKIPLVALNIDRKINKQVSSKGILSLNDKQKSIAPKEIDQSKLEYKNSLEKTYKAHIPHGVSDKMKFDYFYQSQLIWDEAMAENIDKYLKQNPSKTMVVLAGSGHIEQHNGIPSRVFRRNGLTYQVITNNPHNTKKGDLLTLSKKSSSITKENKIGVALKNNDDLTVIKVVDNSFAKKAKILKDDKIIKINEENVFSIADIKRVLYLSKGMKDIEVTVKRKNKLIVLESK